MYRVVCRAVPCQLSAEQRTEQWSGEPGLAAIVLPTFRIIHPWPRCRKEKPRGMGEDGGGRGERRGGKMGEKG